MTKAITVPPVARLIGILLIVWGTVDVLPALYRLAMSGKLDDLEQMIYSARLTPDLLIFNGALIVAGIGLLRVAEWALKGAQGILFVALVYRLFTGLEPMVGLFLNDGYNVLSHIQTVLSVLLRQAPLLLALLYLTTSEVRAAWPSPVPKVDEEADEHDDEEEKPTLDFSTRIDTLLRRLPALPLVVSFIALLLLIWAAQHALSVINMIQRLPYVWQNIDQGDNRFMLVNVGIQLVVLLTFAAAGIGLLRQTAWARAVAMNALGIGLLSGLLYLAYMVMSLVQQPGGTVPFADRELARTNLIAFQLISVMTSAVPYLAALLFLRAAPTTPAPPIANTVG